MDEKESKIKYAVALISATLRNMRPKTPSLENVKLLRKSKYTRHQGEQEKARRRRQIANGQIPEEQILHS